MHRRNFAAIEDIHEGVAHKFFWVKLSFISSRTLNFTGSSGSDCHSHWSATAADGIAARSTLPVGGLAEIVEIDDRSRAGPSWSARNWHKKPAKSSHPGTLRWQRDAIIWCSGRRRDLLPAWAGTCKRALMMVITHARGMGLGRRTGRGR